MTTIVKSALKGAVLGAGIGLGIGLAMGATQEPTTQTSSSWGTFIASDADIRTACETLLEYRPVSPPDFDTFSKNLNSLLKVQNDTRTKGEVRVAWPALAGQYSSKAVDALRRIRKIMEKNNPSQLASMDDTLQAIQKLINDTNFNVTMETNSRMDS